MYNSFYTSLYILTVVFSLGVSFIYYNSTIKERLRGYYKDLTSSNEVLAGICIALSVVPVINLLVACVIILGDAIGYASELHHKYVNYIKRKQEDI